MGQKSQEIPTQFSNLKRMGTAVKVFRARSSLVFNIILGGAFLLISIAALAVAFSIVWDRWGRYYPPVIYQSIFPWMLGAAATLGIFLLILWRTINNRKKAVVIFTDGFATSGRGGVQAWKWEQVEEITADVVNNYILGFYTRTRHTCTLKHSNGKTLVLDDSLNDIESLYHLLENNTIRQRYQRLAAAYNNNQPVIFGAVTIGKQSGIQIGDKTYPWTEIEEIAINQGILSIKKKNGGWMSSTKVPAGKIPNLQVLLSIISQIRGINGGK